MADFASEKSGLSVRYRFMLRNIIELRANKWELKGTLATTVVQAKTIAEVHGRSSPPPAAARGAAASAAAAAALRPQLARGHRSPPPLRTVCFHRRLPRAGARRSGGREA